MYANILHMAIASETQNDQTVHDYMTNNKDSYLFRRGMYAYVYYVTSSELVRSCRECVAHKYDS